LDDRVEAESPLDTVYRELSTPTSSEEAAQVKSGIDTSGKALHEFDPEKKTKR
jgi:hypothetical protein